MRISDWSSDVCSSDLSWRDPVDNVWAFHLACASHLKDGEDHDLDNRWILCLLWPRVLSLTMEAIWIIKSPAQITLGATRYDGLFPLRLPTIYLSSSVSDKSVLVRVALVGCCTHKK